MKPMIKIGAFLLLFIVAAWTVECSFTKKDTFTNISTNTSNAFASTPEKNYQEYCGGCHGEKMDAFVDRKWKHGTSEQELFKAIKVGYPDEGMPGFDSTFSSLEIFLCFVVTGIIKFMF